MIFVLLDSPFNQDWILMGYIGLKLSNLIKVSLLLEKRTHQDC